MGGVVVHRPDGESIVLRDALALIWDVLDEPRTESEICASLAEVTTDDLVLRVREAVVALEAVGVVTRSP